MNVRHVVVLSELLGVEGLASERLSDNSDLEWLEVTFFAELVLHLLDVGSEATLAEPFEVASVLSRLVITFSLITSIGGDKEGGWFRLDVHQEEFTPVEIELERSASGMAWLEIRWDVNGLDKASTDALRNGLNKAALTGLLGVVDTEDVLTFGFGLEDFLHHPGQIRYMDSWNVVLAFSNDRKSFRVLEPRLFEVAVKNGLTLSVEHTSGDNVSFDTGTLCL